MHRLHVSFENTRSQLKGDKQFVESPTFVACDFYDSMIPLLSWCSSYPARISCENVLVTKLNPSAL